MACMGWYIIEAEEGRVFKAQLQLAVSGLHVWLPVIIKRPAHRRKDGKWGRDIREARFGRYFFVKCEMTDSVWSAIKNARYVWRVITPPGGPPSKVPFAAIEWLMREVPQESAPISIGFTKGDIVRLVDGPFSGQVAPIQGIDKRGCLCITLSLFGQSVPVIVELNHVELVTRAPASPRSTGKAPKREGFANGEAVSLP